MSRALRIAGVGCGLLAFVATCATSVACYAVLPAPARDAAQGFLADVRASQWQSAVQRTSAAYQRDHDAARLQREVERLPRLARHTDATFMNATLDGETAVLDGVLVTPDGEVPIAVELEHDAGYWYVDLVVVQGAPLE
ncbi:hypothetical protein [Sandaracinus amylolyticus]|uniref:Lipoprotein n=1 Tax=Sandaracinus amylolyticus TaxID=927083 RepID=A0A0F6W1I6_9BACT|nr:hypothetical protein [Sandaracinus amylolyticus]AKF04858.1 hypothetical protein DB32_002007 [Sandaracinus amylolyticus]